MINFTTDDSMTLTNPTSTMPPDLKRKRSRPSDWWSVTSTSNAPTSPPQRDEPTPKKRDTDAARGIQEAPAAGNRGKRRQVVIEQDGENSTQGGKLARPPRRGRSSNTEAELVAAADLAAEVEAANTKKRGRPVARQQAPANNAIPTKKPVQSAGIDGEDELVAAQAAERQQLSKISMARNNKKSLRRSRLKVEGATSGQPGRDELGQAEKPMKRGRPVSTQENAQAEQPSAAVKRAGRPRKSADMHPTAESMEEASRPPRRGRSSNTEAELRGVAEMAANETNFRKRQGKAAKKEAPKPAADAESVEAAKGKKRPRITQVTEPQYDGPAPRDDVGRTSWVRRSGTIVNVETATSSLAKGRTTNTKGNNRAEAARTKAKTGSSYAQEPSKSRVQAKESKAAANGEGRKNRKNAEAVNEEPPEPKRRRLEKEPEQEPPQVEKKPTYQYLAAVTRRVSHETIAAKWQSLPPGCIELVSKMLQDLQRPVVVTLGDETKRNEALAVVNLVARRLISKVSKGLPFPPAARNHREDDFDYEKILDYNRDLEALLTPVLHANGLLESELAQKKAILESEEDFLAELDANAKSEASVRRDAVRKLHPLLSSNSANDGMNDQISLRKDHIIVPFTHTEDEDLQAIAKDLGGHLITIQGNINKVDGIVEAMIKSKAAVQATLFEHLELEEYEDIVLG